MSEPVSRNDCFDAWIRGTDGTRVGMVTVTSISSHGPGMLFDGLLDGSLEVEQR